MAAFRPVRARTFTPILRRITLRLWLPDSLRVLMLSPQTALPPPSPAALGHGPQWRTWPVGEAVLPGLSVSMQL